MNKWRVELCRHPHDGTCGMFVVRDPTGIPKSRHRSIDVANWSADRWARKGSPIQWVSRVKVSASPAEE